MNACILFILFSVSAYVTPACYTPSVMLEPQDVVYIQHLPQSYTNVVYASPPYYKRQYRRLKRHVHNWRNYHYNNYRRHYRRYHRKRHRSYHRQRGHHNWYRHNKRFRHIRRNLHMHTWH